MHLLSSLLSLLSLL